ncbi:MULTISPECIES: carotenoid biosynthesis protein [Acidiplasma]|jgi:uncharacterized membrane protein|uniref:carotenoid biosynthesis protein n=1 Tax=Acidiplasma TaxID=507753 RepID=UPI0005E9A9C6|nr:MULTISPECIES: carotenoid biosynthesis protein [unclassified Acidiplasma]KJE49889.1 hypothetical protein TZ01_02065 [Acidiplasma sp. MBA-1]WMT55065.1 MAG: carotenoid biosynthesis protein [Acidiplasma sp.]
MERCWKAVYTYLIFGIIMLLIYEYSHIYELAIIYEIVFIFIYIYHSLNYLGSKNTIKFIFLGYFTSLLIEIIGVNSGYPFGRYYYTSLLGPRIYGVPYAIPLFWVSIIYFAGIAGNFRLYSVPFLMVILDLSFDPRFSLHLWHWIKPGIYFGVPLSNFAGWFAASLIIMAVIGIFIKFNKYRISINGMLFYVLFGYFQALEDAVSGLLKLAVVSTIMFTIILIIFLIIQFSINKKILMSQKM